MKRNHKIIFFSAVVGLSFESSHAMKKLESSIGCDFQDIQHLMIPAHGEPVWYREGSSDASNRSIVTKKPSQAALLEPIKLEIPDKQSNGDGGKGNSFGSSIKRVSSTASLPLIDSFESQFSLGESSANCLVSQEEAPGVCEKTKQLLNVMISPPSFLDVMHDQRDEFLSNRVSFWIGPAQARVAITWDPVGQERLYDDLQVRAINNEVLNLAARLDDACNKAQEGCEIKIDGRSLVKKFLDPWHAYVARRSQEISLGICPLENKVVLDQLSSIRACTYNGRIVLMPKMENAGQDYFVRFEPLNYLESKYGKKIHNVRFNWSRCERDDATYLGLQESYATAIFLTMLELLNKPFRDDVNVNGECLTEAFVGPCRLEAVLKITESIRLARENRSKTAKACNT